MSVTANVVNEEAPNGIWDSENRIRNTLICESDAGRIFEVSVAKEIVWDYHSPFMGQGPQNQGRHIYRATRLTADQLAPVIEHEDTAALQHRRLMRPVNHSQGPHEYH